MQIRFLRSNSLGLSGTIRNADHHAKKLLPLVIKLSAKVSQWNFDIWFQSNNVHVFKTHDGRNAILRPVSDENGYQGIKIEASMKTRCANGKGILLAILYHDCRNGVTLDAFADLLKNFSHCSTDQADDVSTKAEMNDEYEEDNEDNEENLENNGNNENNENENIALLNEAFK